ncbi:MAG: malate dehydrogenase, partial [Flavobacteriaceae bacterium]|nr:malate dehydrogenase [Flavobacteriaceae bacterium]
RMIPCSVYLEGEYGLNDICIGVPCIIGSNGIESIVDVQLNAEEKQLMSESANKVAAMNAALTDIL